LLCAATRSNRRSQAAATISPQWSAAPRRSRNSIASASARGDRAGKSLLALADATAREAGLGEAIRHVEPAGARNVKVSFEGANFDALAQWMETLAGGYGVEATELSADRADGAGLVNARVTLQDAP
jgi:general secretion pathway protein M